MNWRNWPYWLRGGVIGGGIAFIFAILSFACEGSSLSLNSPLNSFCQVITFSLFPAGWMANELGGVIFFILIFSPFAPWGLTVASVLIWFTLGSLIGTLLNYLRAERNRQSFLIAMVFIFFVVVAIFLYQRSTPLPDYLTVVSGGDVQQYIGVRHFQTVSDPMLLDIKAIDLSKYPALQAIKDSSYQQRLVAWRTPYGEYVATDDFLSPDGSIVKSDALIVLDVKNENVRSYLFVGVPWFGPDLSRVGENLVIHYIVTPPKQDVFYTFNPKEQHLSPLLLSKDIIEDMRPSHSVYILPNLVSGKYFAVSYCNKTDPLGECRRYGISISNTKTMMKLFDVDNGSFTWGWDADRFFVRLASNKKVFVVNAEEIDWQL